MKDLVSIINKIFLTPETTRDVVIRSVPLLSPEWGVKDEDALVHTLGTNLLAAIGREAGYIGLVEFPVPRAKEWPKKLVRVDSAWIDREEQRPKVLAEFQKWPSQADALDKVANLFVASNGLSTPAAVLILCLWSLDGAALPTIAFDQLDSLAVSGGPIVTCPACSKLIVLQAIFGRREQLLYLHSFRRIK